jgi:signal transduction histidine kinase
MRPLERPRECVLGGVSVALADHLGWSVTVVRWSFVALTFAGGAGILLYLWLWALTPLREPDPAAPDDVVVHRRVPVAWLLVVLAALCGLAGVVVATVSGSDQGLVFAVTLMVALAVGGVAWDQFADDGDVTPRPASSTVLRITTGAFLLAMGAVLTAGAGRAESGWLWLLAIVPVFAGAAVLLGPWAIRLWRELIAERTARIREEQRAEIAAHLHDSVLQTLALIQNRAGASSEVARIARAQERELRDWLYAGAETPDRDLATDLRDFAAVLELDHPVRIEVVAVGEPVDTITAEVAAAAREAMLNASRHAGGEISVYLENSGTSVDVFIRDRGPGFDLSGVPEDRLGVRESIIGRMRRAGGQATVAAGAGGSGTEVHLHLDHGSET